MRRYLEKGKQWIRTHRRSRRHAALQNLCFTLLLLTLSAVLLRGYIAANSVEAAVEKWCEENLFGEAEILSILTYEEEQYNQKEVVIGKELSNGDRYEAKLFMDKKNPLKWENTGCSYFTEAIDYADKATPEEMKECFLELAPYAQIYVEQEAYTSTSIGENNEILEVKLIPSVMILALQETKIDDTAYRQNLRITMDLETGEIRSNIQPLIINGKEATLWMSEERMEFIAEKLMEALPQED